MRAGRPNASTKADIAPSPSPLTCGRPYGRIEAVREAAEGLHQTVAMSANDGKHYGTEIPVADPETVLELRTRLNQHLYKTEGTAV